MLVQCLSNGQNYAIVCPNLTCLWPYSQSALLNCYMMTYLHTGCLESGSLHCVSLCIARCLARWTRWVPVKSASTSTACDHSRTSQLTFDRWRTWRWSANWTLSGRPTWRSVVGSRQVLCREWSAPCTTLHALLFASRLILCSFLQRWCCAKRPCSPRLH